MTVRTRTLRASLKQNPPSCRGSCFVWFGTAADLASVVAQRARKIDQPETTQKREPGCDRATVAVARAALGV